MPSGRPKLEKSGKKTKYNILYELLAQYKTGLTADAIMNITGFPKGTVDSLCSRLFTDNKINKYGKYGSRKYYARN
jgi:hypothetical protein